MASSKIQHRRQRQGSLGLPKDSPPPPMLTAMNGGGGACSGGGGQSGPSQQSLDNLEMMKTIGNYPSSLYTYTHPSYSHIYSVENVNIHKRKYLKKVIYTIYIW